MGFLGDLFGHSELKNKILSLQNALQSSYRVREEEKKEYESKYEALENKYKETVAKYQSLVEHLKKNCDDLKLQVEELIHPEPSPVIEYINYKPQSETAVPLTPERPKEPPIPKRRPTAPKEENNDAFGWVFLTKEYKDKLSALRKKRINSDCLICGEQTAQSDISLQNARKVHESCYNSLSRQIEEITETEAKDYFQNNTDMVCMFKIINSFWEDYPPDWNQRRKLVLERAKHACEECGESETKFHIHHKKELGTGGNHDLNNLICLCVDCHEEKHGGQLKPRRDRWKKRKAKIEEAMAKKTNISFNYIDKKKVRSTRTITPERFKAFDEAGQHLGVRGHCFLANEDRDFYIRRMSNVKILPDKTTVNKCFYHETGTATPPHDA